MHVKNFLKIELHDCDRSKRTSPVIQCQSLQCNQTPVKLHVLPFVFFVCLFCWVFFSTKQPATLAYSKRQRVQNVDKLAFVIES